MIGKHLRYVTLRPAQLPAYILKHNSNRKKQVNLLISPNRKGWHYLAVKRLPALLREISSEK